MLRHATRRSILDSSFNLILDCIYDAIMADHGKGTRGFVSDRSDISLCPARAMHDLHVQLAWPIRAWRNIRSSSWKAQPTKPLPVELESS